MKMKTGLISAVLVSGLAAGTAFAQPVNSGVPAGVIERQSHTEVSPSVMIGKRVLGRYQEFLGTIVAVDENKQSADMKTATGSTLALSLDMLVVDGEHVSAPTISRGDVIGMTRKLSDPVQEVKGSVTK